MWGWVKKIGVIGGIVGTLCILGTLLYNMGHNKHGEDISARDQTISRLTMELESYKDAAKLDFPQSVKELTSLAGILNGLSKKISISIGAEEELRKITEENHVLREIDKKNVEKIHKLSEIVRQYEVSKHVFSIDEKGSNTILGKYTVSVEKINYYNEKPTTLVRAITNAREHYENNMRLNDKIEYSDDLQACTLILTSLGISTAGFTLLCEQSR